MPALGSDAAYLDAVLLTSGVDYQAIGHAAGQEAVKVLNGKNVSAMPVAKPQKAQIKINEDMAKAIGMDVAQLKAAIK